MIRTIYYTSKRIKNAVNAFYNQISKPESYIKGDEFEDFVRAKIYTSERYELVMVTHDFHKNKSDFVESSKHPDFLFRDKNTGDEFYVEAKYRENFYGEKLEWCQPYQFTRYKQIGLHKKVIVCIGLGGRPTFPKHVYIIPLNEIKYNALYPKTIAPYEHNIGSRKVLEKLKDMVYG